jgi:hypothetical protein
LLLEKRRMTERVACAPTLITTVTRLSGRTHRHKHALGSRQLLGPGGVSVLRRMVARRYQDPPATPEVAGASRVAL